MASDSQVVVGTSSKENVENVARQVLLLHTILPSCVTIIVILRIYSRCFWLRSAGWDDWLLTVGFVCNPAIIAFEKYSLLTYTSGCDVGERQPDLLPNKVRLGEAYYRRRPKASYWLLQGNPPLFAHSIITNDVSQIMYCEPILYIFSHFCIKNSFLAFYLRLTASKNYRLVCWILISLNVCIYLASTLAGAFGCTPVTFFWDKTIPTGHCVHLTALYMSNGFMNMSMDICILTLPIFMIWRNTTLPFDKKVRVSMLLLLGVFTCACSVVRMPFLSRALLDGDITWDAVHSHRWSNIEIHIAVIASCIPAIKPLFLHCIGFRSGPLSHGSRSRYRHSNTLNEVYTESADPNLKTFFNANDSPEPGTWNKELFGNYTNVVSLGEARSAKTDSIDGAVSAHLYPVQRPDGIWVDQEITIANAGSPTSVTWDDAARRAAQARLAGALEARRDGGVEGQESMETLKEDADRDRRAGDEEEGNTEGWCFNQTESLPVETEEVGNRSSKSFAKRWRSLRR